METFEIETGARPDAAVLWLHGLGADGHDFEPIIPELGLPASARIRFVFPNAPVRPVTLNQGMRMRAWYDIFQLGGGAEDEAGIRASQALLEELISEQKKKNISAPRIVLAGFSQGGAIALQTAVRHEEKLAGILALSTYLPLAGKLAAEKDAASAGLPVFMAHGTHDDVIPITRAEQSAQALAQAGLAVEWLTYAMPHSVCMEEIADISAFLQKVL